MDLKSAVEQEIMSYKCSNDQRIATVGTTARKTNSFAVLPRREAWGFEAINFLVVDQQSAETLFQLIDKKVKYILVDIEMKKDLDLLSIASKTVQHAVVVTYKPNDTTLEAADFFLRHYFNDDLEGKKIIVYGAGNLGSKLSLRLAERGAEIHLGSRNEQKAMEIIKALNHLLPAYTKSKISLFKAADVNKGICDGLVSFTSASAVIPPSYSKSIKADGLALDGGIDNFTKNFIKKASKKNIHLYRLDVRSAFPHAILYLEDYIKNFYSSIQGENLLDGIRMVAGGIIGREGDIVVDRIERPTQIVGIANGVGGLKDRAVFSSQESDDIRKVYQRINQNSS
ncbi:hypothetical protein [Jeotgalibacillus salarius]|uniref:Quinate/shikimate 5-dehydrogenase/glutamyl-tRNA reductase domain-containing protein n=1 Tax=Jeotgalibacillus salarius TaxID=546023 RepID=A0A4Y8LM70_9BACL|nr:hypothetical protein [Jeotgalibacillus salarius]TFE04132.1 hypothetical protein E2626_02055 [Jeotgalibacillus salarius]